MTREEVIEKLKRERNGVCHGCAHPSMVGWCENHCKLPEAYDVAIEALGQPEIIFCKDCEKHNKRFDEYPADEACPLTVWRVAQEHEFDYQFCVYAERRTDEQPD